MNEREVIVDFRNYCSQDRSNYYRKKLNDVLSKYLVPDESRDAEYIQTQYINFHSLYRTANIMTIFTVKNGTLNSNDNTMEILDLSDFWENLNDEQKYKIINELEAICFSTLYLIKVITDNEKRNPTYTSQYSVEDFQQGLTWVYQIISDLLDVDLQTLINEMRIYTQTIKQRRIMSPHIFVLRVLRAISDIENIDGFEDVKNIDWENFGIYSEAELYTHFPNGLPWGWFNAAAVDIYIKLALDSTFYDYRKKKYDGSDESYENVVVNFGKLFKNGGCLVPIVSLIASLLFVLVL